MNDKNAITPHKIEKCILTARFTQKLHNKIKVEINTIGKKLVIVAKPSGIDRDNSESKKVTKRTNYNRFIFFNIEIGW